MLNLTLICRRKVFSWALSLLFIGILSPSQAFTTENNVDNLAKTILSTVGVNVGICEMPRVGDGQLAAALALHGVSVVHGLVPDQKAATHARQPAISAGVMGSQVTIEIGNSMSLPLSEGLADLYLVVDATDDLLNTLSAAEAGRILAPYRGVSMVGNPLGAEGGLSQAKLETWARETGGTVVVHNENGGLWAVATMPPLKGGDDWGHFYHGPNLDPVSHDSAFAATDYQLQAYDFPINGSRNFTVVASAGRYFVANSSLYSGDQFSRAQVPWELVARSITNAKVLWRRPLKVRFGDMGSLMVATPDRFFLKDDTDVLVLNPETGEELNRIKVTQEPLNVQWIVVSEDVLLTLAGPRAFNPVTDGGTFGKTAALAYEESSHGQILAAWESKTGTALWQYSAKSIATRKLAVSANLVLLTVDEKQAVALDLQSGKEMWTTPAPHLITDVTSKFKKFSFNNYRGEPSAIASTDAYVLMDSSRQQYCAFSLKDGRLLWDMTKTKTFKNVPSYGYFLNQRLFGDIDIFSGEKSAEMSYMKRQRSASCGHFTLLESNQQELFVGFGVGEMESGKQIVPYVNGSACGTGFFIANGTQVMYPNTCACTRGWHGMMLIKPLGKPAPKSGTRGEKGLAELPKLATSDAKDWTSYRSDLNRKGSSEALITKQSSIRWTYMPPRPIKGSGLPIQPWYMQANQYSTQVISVGDSLWFGTAEGSVVCLDRTSGNKKWEYWTAGAILSSPAWSEGCIFVGSADGSIYCINAESGLLCWRYRVAPTDRRINFMSHLSSSWPVRSILVRDGTAYATAGILGRLDGSAMCAVDVKTGDPLWSNVMTNSGNNYPNGKMYNDAPTGAEGAMAWYSGKLWWLTSDLGPIVIDPPTGHWKQALDPKYLASPAERFAGMDEVKVGTWFMASGKDLGILPGGWVTFGNSLMFGACDKVTHTFMKSGPDGPQVAEGEFPGLLTLNRLGNRFLGSFYTAREIPVWDSKEILFYDNTVKSFGPPTLYTDFYGALDQALAEVSTKALKAKKRIVSADELVQSAVLKEPASKKRLAFPDALWTDIKKKTLKLYGSMLLASNAVIFTTFQGLKSVPDMRNGRMANDGTWRVTGIDRKDQSTLFDIKLPSAPAPSGMSMSRAGDVLIPLVDGRIVCVGGGPFEDKLVAAIETGKETAGWQLRRYQTDIPLTQYYSCTEADLAIMKPIEKRVITQLNYSADLTNRDRQDIVFITGNITVTKSGIYHLFGKCPEEDRIKFWIHDRSGQFDEHLWEIMGKYAKNNGLSSPDLFLTSGKHPISILYLPTSKESTFQLQWDGPEILRSDIPVEVLSH